ncbi:hypothetical protein P0L94_07140 [Microbacter sp. GSS18]|nr:hypothetical protein P0L94_07140 [Microbacter sp. GSS18]
MSRTLKERIGSRDGLIAAWVCTALAWGGAVAVNVIANARGLDPLESTPILAWLLIGVVAAAAVVFALRARRSYPNMIAAVVPVVLAGPVALIAGGGAMLLIGYDIYAP